MNYGNKTDAMKVRSMGSQARKAKEDEAMRKEVEDMRMRKKAGAAYDAAMPMKKGGKVMKYAKGGSIDGCATKGKTKGKMV
jgi:hypothetical protein